MINYRKALALLGIIFICSRVIAQLPTSGLLAWYPFNSNSNDESGNGNNGTLYGTLFTYDRFGMPNSACSFNGVDEYMISNINSTITNYSISLWFRTSGSGVMFTNSSTNDLTAGQGDKRIYMNNSGQIITGVYNSGVYSITTSGTYNDYNWHHVVLRQDNTSISLFIDNLLYSSYNHISGTNSNYWFGIGYSYLISDWPNRPTSYYFNGLIDDIAIYNRAITNNEISVLYNLMPPAPVANFCASSTFIFPGEAVDFTDLSLNSPSSWYWSFGDGQTSASQNPVHTYNSQGVYSVTLSVNNSVGSNNMTKYNYIYVGMVVDTSCAIDRTFGNNGKIYTDFGINNGTDDVCDIAVQTDGKIVVLGSNSTYSPQTQYSTYEIARYNVDGSPDYTFGGSGKVSYQIGSSINSNCNAEALALQNDGKIVIVGSTFSDISEYDFAIVRLNYNGSLDQTFGTNGVVYTENFNTGAGYSMDLAKDVAIQPDGKIIVVGSTWYSRSDFAVARYNTNGTQDASFGNNGKVVKTVGGFDEAKAVAIQPDGKIIVAGRSINSTTDYALIRCNSDGTIDQGFGTNGQIITDFYSSSDEINDIKIQPDGKIIVGGFSMVYNGLSAISQFSMARYNSTGVLDNSFGTGGKVVSNFGTTSNSQINAIKLLSNGDIIAAGFTFYIGGDFLIAKYKPSGILDANFCTYGASYTDFGSNDVLRGIDFQNNKIVAAGTTSALGNLDFAVTRYNIVNYGIENEENIYNNQFDFIIYPNPVCDKLNIEIKNNGRQINFEIFNSIGHIIKKGQGVGKIEINTENYDNGLYFIKLYDDKYFDVRKFVKSVRL